METPPIHVLLALDAQILGGEAGKSGPNWRRRRLKRHVSGGPATTRTTARFWGVSRRQVACASATGKKRHIGYFDDEQEAARAVDAIATPLRRQDARRTRSTRRGASAAQVGRRSSAVVAPPGARAPTTTTSKFGRAKRRRWAVQYPTRTARSATSACTTPRRPPRTPSTPRSSASSRRQARKTNPVVDGQTPPAIARAARWQTPPRRRRDAVDAPPPRLENSHHLTPAPPRRTPAPSRTGSRRRSRRAG